MSEKVKEEGSFKVKKKPGRPRKLVSQDETFKVDLNKKEEDVVEEEEKTKTDEDLTLENPFGMQTPQQPQQPQMAPQPTGQVTAQQVQQLFPFDTTTAAIAQRRQNRG